MRLKSEITEEVKKINLDDFYSPEIYDLIEAQSKESNKYFICAISSEKGVLIALNILKFKEKHKRTKIVLVLCPDSDYQGDSSIGRCFIENATGIIATSEQFYNNAFSAPNSTFIGEFKMTALQDGLCYAMVNPSVVKPSFIEVFDGDNTDSPLYR